MFDEKTKLQKSHATFPLMRFFHFVVVIHPLLVFTLLLLQPNAFIEPLPTPCCCCALANPVLLLHPPAGQAGDVQRGAQGDDATAGGAPAPGAASPAAPAGVRVQGGAGVAAPGQAGEAPCGVRRVQPLQHGRISDIHL